LFSRISSRRTKIFLIPVHTDLFNFSQPRSGKKISSKVCSKFFKQGPVDPDQHFNRYRDRAKYFSRKVRLKKIRPDPVFFPAKYRPGILYPRAPSHAAIKMYGL